MPVKSVFEFNFPAQVWDDGLRLARAIGNDMPPLPGYLDHEVIQDVTDAGHVMVNTRWASREQAEAVLKRYNDDPKIKKANELIPGGPKGFVGEVIV